MSDIDQIKTRIRMKRTTIIKERPKKFIIRERKDPILLLYSMLREEKLANKRETTVWSSKTDFSVVNGILYMELCKCLVV
jgi:hypothetical protein